MTSQLTHQLLQQAITAIENQDLETLKECLSQGLDINAADYKEGNTVLIHAVAHNNREITQFLLNAGAHINQSNYFGNAPLHAGLNGHADINLIGYLIEKGADVNQPSNTMFPLHIAIDQNNLPAIRLLIENGALVNVSGFYNTIEHAIMKESKDIVEYLLIQGADVNKKNTIGRNPLHLALSLNYYQFEIVALLIRHGADIHTRDEEGQTPLHLANVEVARLLLERGANVNARDSRGNTPLILAVNSRECFDLVKLLLAYDADPNAIDNENMSVLFNFCHGSDYNMQTFKMLVDAGADITFISKEDSLSLLHIMYHPRSHELQNELIKIMEFLIQKGLDINQDSGLGTPLAINAYWGHEKVVDFLLKNGAAITAITEKEDTPLHTVMYSELRPNLVQTLLNNGVSVNAQNKLGDTALHIFIDRNPYHKEEVYEILSLLKNNGADFSIKNNDSLTPLLIAAKQSNVKIVKYLLDECGANINETDATGNSALHIAIKRNYYDMVYLLLNRTSIIKANHAGQTPLHVAVQDDAMQLIPIIYFLLSKGIDINAIDNEGKTVLDYAIDQGNEETIAFLKQNGALVNKN